MPFWRKSKPPQEQLTERFWDEESLLGYFKQPCPSCGAIKVYYDLTCHTWGGDSDGKGWKACLPCSSAAFLTCNNESCDWSYTWGHNKNNPRFKDEESRRPFWLVGDWPY